MLYSTRPTIVKLTKAQYDALDPADKTNDTIYFITDVNGTGDKFQPIIYSEEEREIGVWTDGKPLYEKTFKVDNISIDTSHATEIADLTTLNVETWVGVVNSVGYIHAYDITVNENRLSIGYKPTSKKLVASQSYTQQYTTVDIITTIRYTKTIDTPGSGKWTPQGVPAVHYSTEEQVVGTWADGSTLYEKTYIVEIENATNQILAELPNNINVKEMTGMIDNNQNGVFIPINWYDGSLYYRVVIDDFKIKTFKRYPGDWAGKNVQVSIKYTKSST